MKRIWIGSAVIALFGALACCSDDTSPGTSDQGRDAGADARRDLDTTDAAGDGPAKDSGHDGSTATDGAPADGAPPDSAPDTGAEDVGADDQGTDLAVPDQLILPDAPVPLSTYVVTEELPDNDFAGMLVSVDDPYTFIAARDPTPGLYQLRIEKRDADGELVPAFEDHSVTTASYTPTAIGGMVQSNPSDYREEPMGMVIDGDDLYLLAYSEEGGGHWRYEKRDKTTGALITAFEDHAVTDGVYTPVATGGVVQSNATDAYETLQGLAVDADAIYLVGADQVSKPWQLRIEKRDKTTGALLAAFDGDGVVQSDPSPGIDIFYGVAVDGDHLYVAGIDAVSGDDQWRVEKRDKVTGQLVTAFEDHSVVNGAYTPVPAGGVVQSNPSTGTDRVEAMALDGDYLYIAGYGRSLGNDQWRVEKRNKVNGALVAQFEDHGVTDGVNTPVAVPGVLQSNPSTKTDRIYHMALDGMYLYLVGYDALGALDRFRLRVEKRSAVTGGF